MQNFTNDKLSQIYLLNNFNEFVTQAALHLAETATVKPMDEEGCCLAFALCNLKKANEGQEALNEFYLLCNIVTQYFSPKSIAQMIERAKFTPEELLAYKNAGKRVPRYKDFSIEYLPGHFIQFEKIYNFMATIASAQTGFHSILKLGRFGSAHDITKKGVVESIAGNFENNHLLLCNAQSITECLRDAGLAYNRYALITTGGHAINYRHEGPHCHYVYDSNQKTRPEKLRTLEEVGAAIHLAFTRRLGHVTPSGDMILCVQGVSFGQGSVIP